MNSQIDKVAVQINLFWNGERVMIEDWKNVQTVALNQKRSFLLIQLNLHLGEIIHLKIQLVKLNKIPEFASAANLNK